MHQRVIAPDLPGFGRSDPLPRYAIPDIIHVLLDLLDTLNIPSATLVGSSLGGMLSHAIAIAYPDRVQGLVLIDGHLAANKQKLSLGSLLFMVPGIGEWLYNRYRKHPQAAYDSLRPFYANLDNLPAADREFLFQRVNERVWSDRQRRAYLATMRNTASWMIAQQRALKDNLKTLAVPTLVIFGEEDHIIPIENAAYAAGTPIDRAAGHTPGRGASPAAGSAGSPAGKSAKRPASAYPALSVECPFPKSLCGGHCVVCGGRLDLIWFRALRNIHMTAHRRCSP